MRSHQVARFIVFLAYLIFSTNCGTTLAASLDDASLAVLEITHGSKQGLCRGAAVASHTILTAAHCIADQDLEWIRVITVNEDSVVNRALIHPRYNSKPKIPEFDIALITTIAELTVPKLPIIVSTKLYPGDTFIMFTSRYPGPLPSFAVTDARKMIVADTANTLLDYIRFKWGDNPSPKIVAEIKTRLSLGDSQMQDKVKHEFGNYYFSLYAKNKSSVCLGDSGSPALYNLAGVSGIIGLATAVGQLEPAANPKCPEGGTSIFTALGEDLTAQFIHEFDPSIKTI